LTTVLIRGAFVIVAENFASFGDALVKKLVAENRPGASAASRQPALAVGQKLDATACARIRRTVRGCGGAGNGGGISLIRHVFPNQFRNVPVSAF